MRGTSQWPIVLAVVSCLTACPSNEGSLSAPTMLGAQLTTFDRIEVRFQPPPHADALEAEGRVAAGEWLSIGTGPGDSDELLLDLLPDAPEDADYGFKVRAVRGATTSAWSEEGAVHRGVRPATNLQVFAQYDQPIQLAWTRGSTQAEVLRLDRRWVRFDGVDAGWSQLASLPLDATSYQDADTGAWLDGSSFDYRVVYVKGAAESEPATASGLQARPLAPVGLSCAPAGEAAIQLTWTPRSQYATRQVVVRSGRWGPGSSEIATLPADAASYLDAGVAPGQYVYYVSARVGEWVGVVNYVSDGEPALGFTALTGLPLLTSSLAFPAGDQAVRRADGRFATITTASTYPTNLVRTWQETASGWSSRDATLDGYPQLAQPALLLGPADRLDLLYGQVLGGAWHDWTAGAWSTEPLPAALPQDAVEDASGALHLVACQGFADYTTNAIGTWVTERLPASAYVDRCAIAIGPDGEPRVAYTSPQPVPPGQGGSASRSDLYLLGRSGAAWVEEQVPLGAEATQRYASLLRVFAPSASQVVIIYARPAPAVGDVSVGAVERDSAGWGAPTALGLRPFDGAPESFAAASSPDGARVAITWNGFPSSLWLRSAAGVWTSGQLQPNGLGMALGFSPAGKLWVLDGLGGALGGILYEEP